MTNTVAAFVCATGLWVICTAAAFSDFPKPPAGEAWVVTASDKMPDRPVQLRANVRFQAAAANITAAN